jgi:phosphoesterase RecJ-like protein
MMSRKALQAARDLIRAADRILLAAHVDPDGDALGAMLGLYWGLRGMGKECLACCADPVPQVFSFLPGSGEIARRGRGDEGLIIALDAGQLERLGSAYDETLFQGVPVLNIDHHTTNTLFGQVNLVDASSPSTVELVMKLLVELDIPLDARIATCLLTGIVHDTQCFRTANTIPSTLRAAAELMEAGASLRKVVDKALTTRSAASLHLWGGILDGLRVSDGVVWAWETLEMHRRSGAAEDEGRGLINLLAGAQEAEVAVLFRERGEGIVDISMRSQGGLDVSQVALAFGGGGHRRAAGCVVKGSPELVEGQVLEEIKERLRTAET